MKAGSKNDDTGWLDENCERKSISMEIWNEQ